MYANWNLLYLEAVNYAFIIRDDRTKEILLNVADSYRKLVELQDVNNSASLDELAPSRSERH